MAYKKAGYRKKRMHRRPHKRHAPSNKSLNKKIHHIENSLIELKFKDVVDAGTTITNTGVQDLLCPIVQDDTASGRNGNRVFPTSIHIRAELITDPDQVSVLNGPTWIRCILFWDRQPNGAAPTIVGASNTQSLLDNTVVNLGYLSPRNFNTIKRYKILYDKVITLNPQVVLTTVAGPPSTSQVVPMGYYLNFTKKLGRMIQFNDTTGVIGSIETNSLYIMYICNVTAGANQPQVVAGYRLYYRDA